MKIHIPLITLCMAIFSGLSSTAWCDRAVQTNIFILPENKSIQETLWLAADKIDVRGTIGDDLFLMATQNSLLDSDKSGGTVRLAGTFENDVWALGEDIALSGVVFDHARIFAQVLNVSGTVNNSAILAGNTVTMATNACLCGPALILGESMICEGRCEDDVTFMGMSVTLSGLFLGDVRITASEIVILPETEILGNLIYAAPAELVLGRNVILHGALLRSATEATKSPIAMPFSMANLLTQSWLYCGAVLTALVFLRLFTRPAATAAMDVRHAFWKCILAGFVGIAMLTLTAVFSAFSVIGLPLAGVCLLVIWLLLYMGKIIAGTALGLMVMRKSAFGTYGGLLSACVVGLWLLYLGANLPILGLFVQVFSTLAGLGAIILNLLSNRSQPPPLPATAVAPPAG